MNQDIPTNDLALSPNEILKLEMEPVSKKIDHKGSPLSIMFTSFGKKRAGADHIFMERGGLTYDLPSDGEMSLVLNILQDDGEIPLAIASLTLIDGIPTINMIQRVKAMEKESGSGGTVITQEGHTITFGETRKKVTHPFNNLLQGEDKLEWSELLISQCESMVKLNGFQQIQVVSGFDNPYLRPEQGYSLSLAIQQYDLFFDRQKDYIPYDQNGLPINESEKRRNLSSILRKVRSRKINSLEELKVKHPNFTIPKYWRKQL